MRAHKTYDSLGRGMEEEDIALMHRRSKKREVIQGWDIGLWIELLKELALWICGHAYCKFNLWGERVLNLILAQIDQALSVFFCQICFLEMQFWCPGDHWQWSLGSIFIHLDRGLGIVSLK